MNDDLTPLLQACASFLFKAARRRLSTLQLIEPAHRLERSYHTALQRVYQRGTMELAQIQKQAVLHRDPLSHATSQAVHRTIEEIRQGMLKAADTYYPRAFTIGAEHVARTLGASTLPQGRAEAVLTRRRQKNAHYVDKSLLDDLRQQTADRLQWAARVLSSAQVHKADEREHRRDRSDRPVPVPPDETPTDATPTDVTPPTGADPQVQQTADLLLLFLTIGATVAGLDDVYDRVTGVTEAATATEAFDVITAAFSLLAREIPGGDLLAILADFTAAQANAQDDSQRIGAYASTIWEVMNLGFTSEAGSAATEEGVRLMVDWQTTSGDPCDDCLALEEDAPYELSQLPTLPGAGDTQCLTNCRCILELQPAEE